jgi:hypothetical protein
MMVLGDVVRHHMREEEREIFPAVREGLTRTQLVELGDTLRDERRVAPTVPPPSAQAVAVVENATDRAQSLVHKITAPLRSIAS